MGLLEIERCYDAIPRVSATTEEVGPFTLFRAVEGTSWNFYARPRLGLETEITPDDVRRLLARQTERDLPHAIEWVHEVTPSLLPAVRTALPSALPDADVAECPLLAMTGVANAGVVRDVLVTSDGPDMTETSRTNPTIRILTADDPELEMALGAVGAGFGGRDEVEPTDAGHRPALIEAGTLIVAAAYDEAGRIVGGGSAAPRGHTAELMGISTVPSARRQGYGAAVTRALVTELAQRGVTTLFLSAGSDDAASIYRSVGFERVGTACILESGGH
ncbi:MAG TPA: GNAT family N-acetyltransferase [Kribbellaceae bacterium]|nr:GNAT family N-acetyltransferase [Kribbellaceae bacterium]